MSIVRGKLEKLRNKQQLPLQVWLIRHDLVNRLRRRQGFGLNEVIGIAAGLLIAGVVIIPGLVTLSETVIDSVKEWWTTFSEGIFTV